MFFFLEETIYFRDNTLSGVAASAVPAYQDNSLKQEERSNEAISSGEAKDPEQTMQIYPLYQETRKKWEKYRFFRALPGRPSNFEMLCMAYRPVIMIFRFPTVAWAGFYYGINLAWYNVLNGTVSPVLVASPYNWSASLVGCVYAGPIIGAAVAALWSGNVADCLALWLARRNSGVREAEHRLWVLAGSGIVCAAGLIIWGVGAYHNIHWLGLVCGLGMLAFGCVTGGSIAVSYNVDCFKEIGGETTVSLMLIRNTIGFGFSYVITPWWTNQGLQNCFITAAMISLACTGTFLVMVLLGKRIRRWCMPAYMHYAAGTVIN